MTVTTALSRPASLAGWQPISTSNDGIGVAERTALGTTARVAVWPPEYLRDACARVDTVLGELDLQASRFRPDSEICWLHRAGGGLFLLSDGLAEAVGVALAAARWTGGLADPTIGNAVIALGYDRDFAAIVKQRTGPLRAPQAAPGWQRVRLDGAILRLPAEVQLDLGATAKGLGADRAVRAVMSARAQPGGVLVGLGGDLAVAGTPPAGGWPVTVADGPDPGLSLRTQLVRLTRGAIATSSVTCRQWRRAGQMLHHIIDPRTGLPTQGPWQTVSAAAATCADANAVTTAAIVAGDQAEDWLATAGLPARLVASDGAVRYLGGWPEAHGAAVPVPAGSHVYGARGGGR